MGDEDDGETKVPAPTDASRSLFSLNRVISSSAAKGSSISRTRGRVTSPRAIETRIFMPPDKLARHGVLEAGQIDLRIEHLFRPAVRPLGRFLETPCSRSGSQTLSKTVAHGISVGSWKTKPMSCSAPSAARASRERRRLARTARR
jgi:hypothetical protein